MAVEVIQSIELRRAGAETLPLGAALRTTGTVQSVLIMAPVVKCHSQLFKVTLDEIRVSIGQHSLHL